MIKLLNFTPTHFVCGLILGITTQYFLEIWKFSFGKSVIFFSFLLMILSLLKVKKKPIFFSLLTWVLFFLIGLFSVFIHNDTNYENHYSNFIKSNEHLVFKVEKQLKPNQFYDKYIASVIQVGSKITRGKILVSIEKDSLKNKLKIADKFLSASELEPINPPLNPHQFNYKKYLEKQDVHHQLFIKKNAYLKVEAKEFSILKFVGDFRNSVDKSLKKYAFKDDELAVINALLLGQRNEISEDLLQSYTNAGAIHILAVSGLHVGIILLILNLLFKPLERLKSGKVIKTICVVTLLWMFAFIAGLSASVVRAVTMFTAVAIAMSLNRKTLIYHSLLTSIFILLLCNPLFLFDVGFQLSYLAVFGIVWIQPKLYGLWHTKWFLTNKIWQLFTVSTAAQIGVLPISLFYFHQFPGLFMLSNLVIIPFIGFILFLGILVIALALFNFLPQFLADGYMSIISLMNSFVNWVSKQESFLIDSISFSGKLLLVSYACIFFGIQFFSKKTVNRLMQFLVSIAAFQLVLIVEKNIFSTKEELIIFHQSKQSVVGSRFGKSIQLYTDLDSLDIVTSSAIQSFKIGEEIQETYFQKVFPNIVKFKNKTLLLVDDFGIYQLENLQNPMVLLRKSPKINLERLIVNLKPSIIIVDGSNYKNNAVEWKKICEKYAIPFHHTGTKGAFILR